MTDYRAPLDDIDFVLSEVSPLARVLGLPRYAALDVETVRRILAEGARLAESVLAGVNGAGDAAPARLDTGGVRAATGFDEAWRAYADGGWPSLDLPEAYGGQDVPLLVQVAFAEMVNGANVAFGMLPIMLRAAAWLLIEHADEALRERVVPKLASGEWAATICISEPQAGSDVGRITTRAVPVEEGAFDLTGTKIWITYGDHDLTDQICHMVLARTPDAAPGTRGLSLFVVPKFDFVSGERNAVHVSRVEQKMGLAASPTCVLELSGARGYRVGDEGRGLASMFTMVNLMRLEVAVQGLAIGAAAAAAAARYAGDRRQGGAPDRPPVPIARHTDVRRQLFFMQARVRPMRALIYETAAALDVSRFSTHSGERDEARAFAEFMLPVLKAGASELGFDVASEAIQVFGGNGYVRDYGVEQYARDARVMAIYEGTNGIQALDLVTRKLLRDDAMRFSIVRARMRADRDRLAPGPYDAPFDAALAHLDASVAKLSEAATARMVDVEAGATDFLHLTKLVACAWMWLRLAAASGGDEPAQRLNRQLADFYFSKVLPEAALRASRIAAGAGPLEDPALDALVPMT